MQSPYLSIVTAESPRKKKKISLQPPSLPLQKNPNIIKLLYKGYPYKHLLLFTVQQLKRF